MMTKNHSNDVRHVEKCADWGRRGGNRTDRHLFSLVSAKNQVRTRFEPEPNLNRPEPRLKQNAPQNLRRYGPAQSLHGQQAAEARKETPWRPVRKGPYADLDNLDENIMKQIKRLPGLLAYVRLDYDATLEAEFPSHPCSPPPSADDRNSSKTSDYNAFPMLIYSIAIGVFSPHEVEVDFYILDKEACAWPGQESSVKVSVTELNETLLNLLTGPRISDEVMADLAAHCSPEKKMYYEWTDVSVIHDLPPTQESSRQLLRFTTNRDPRIIRAKDRTSQNLPAWLHKFHANIIPWRDSSDVCYTWNTFMLFFQEYHFLRDDVLDMYAALTAAEPPRPLEVRDDLALLPVTKKQNNHSPFIDPCKGDVAVWNLCSFFRMEPVKYLVDKQTLCALALCNKSLILPCRGVLFRFLSFTIRPETSDSLSHRLQELRNLILHEGEIANVGEEYKFLVDDKFLDELDHALGHALRSFSSFMSNFAWIRLKVDKYDSIPPNVFWFAKVLPPSSPFEMTRARRGEADLIRFKVNSFIQGKQVLEKMRNSLIDSVIESERIGLNYVEPYTVERMWLDWRMDNVKNWIAKREFQRKLSRWEPELKLDFLLDNAYVRPQKDTDARMI
ncbi:hypothetical protein BD410DRAFT_831516 [Rickenella mellea]|uniref:Uncharacterized protein n=1 Tax=Rickenella mellea TaxID=50990 RepID=A0A4Y7PQS6_9AGAM|nr:hypothetical protein BD410DRAFT_831516 [Rickenella mellea]